MLPQMVAVERARWSVDRAAAASAADATEWALGAAAGGRARSGSGSEWRAITQLPGSRLAVVPEEPARPPPADPAAAPAAAAPSAAVVQVALVTVNDVDITVTMHDGLPVKLDLNDVAVVAPAAQAGLARAHAGQPYELAIDGVHGSTAERRIQLQLHKVKVPLRPLALTDPALLGHLYVVTTRRMARQGFTDSFSFLHAPRRARGPAPRLRASRPRRPSGSRTWTSPSTPCRWPLRATLPSTS